MKYAYELSNKTFLSLFEEKSLDPKYFSHLGHIRLAWIYLNKYEHSMAVDKACVGIKAYASSLGATDKFNMTMSVAMMEIISHRINKLDDKSWQTFMANNTDLIENSFAILLKYYSKEQLFSNAAKMTVLKPDLRPIESASETEAFGLHSL